ncbi:sigma-70 family RNA polymerase sigma factor [Paenibacillus sp. MSJ-34]|uniref:sigma-70 family RNA polymerase sigma factor n=1 Tax=Paenibacillus sp. MSJ-34 TaxID=2841529 RepID=UPI001C114D15|nr:sigma-70 family RNA polymerase sigma factor [Paenibacillus sp. MSJ-34]MBU5445502.1 sigma-70 family RNA polymerase sigma factor [Paenibacillus sp. MSJ-34]
MIPEKSFRNESKKVPKAIPYFTDYIVRRFFSYPKYYHLLCLYLENPSHNIWIQLEKQFKLFHFEVRFSKYLSSTIRFAYIDFYRKKRKKDQRDVVIFDMKMYEENGNTFGDKYISHIEYEEKGSTDPQILLDSMKNESLYKAFSELTQKQKVILTSTYCMGYIDKEIAKMLSITPQAVSKTRNSALVTLKKRMRREV